MAKKPGWRSGTKGTPLRSVRWFGREDIYGFIYRSWTKNRGIPQDQFDGRPVIGICNTYSELVPCNSHFRTIAEQRLVDDFATKYKKTVVKSDRAAFQQAFIKFHTGPDATWDKALYDRVQAIK